MSASIIDLDVLAPLPLKVRLGGEVYRVPGSPPMGFSLQLMQLQNADGNDELDTIEALLDCLVDLFTTLDPGLDQDALRKVFLGKGAEEVLAIVGRIYDTEVMVEETPQARPTRQAGTRSTSRSKTSRSRSSS